MADRGHTSDCKPGLVADQVRIGLAQRLCCQDTRQICADLIGACSDKKDRRPSCLSPKDDRFGELVYMTPDGICSPYDGARRGRHFPDFGANPGLI
ncbi:MAG: hypothetical protein ACI8TF_001899 [Paracoccaceae bacterium]|jgi:hypothetical protein